VLWEINQFILKSRELVNIDMIVISQILWYVLAYTRQIESSWKILIVNWDVANLCYVYRYNIEYRNIRPYNLINKKQRDGVNEWVNEWVSEWVSEWVRERERERER